MRWLEALKKWNSDSKGTWCIPKKGSYEYNEVKRLMEEKPKKQKRPAIVKASAPVPAPSKPRSLSEIVSDEKRQEEERRRKMPIIKRKDV